MLVAFNCRLIKCNMCECDSNSVQDYHQRFAAYSYAYLSEAAQDQHTHQRAGRHNTFTSCIKFYFGWGASIVVFCCRFYIFSTDLCKSLCLYVSHTCSCHLCVYVSLLGPSATASENTNYRNSVCPHTTNEGRLKK